MSTRGSVFGGSSHLNLYGYESNQANRRCGLVYNGLNTGIILMNGLDTWYSLVYRGPARALMSFHDTLLVCIADGASQCKSAQRTSELLNHLRVSSSINA